MTQPPENPRENAPTPPTYGPVPRYGSPPHVPPSGPSGDSSYNPVPGGSPETPTPGTPPAWGQPGPAGPPAYGAPQSYGNPGQYGGQPYGNQPYANQAYAPAAAPTRTDYAPWLRRVGAMLVDQAPAYVGYIVFFVGYIPFLRSLSSGQTPTLSGGAVAMIVGSVIMLAAFGWTIYNRWIVAGRTGQSLGKRVLKLWLVSEQTGAPVGPLNAFLRDLVHIVDGFAYVGYLWPLWDVKKQTFADKLMQTAVVTTPLPPVSGPPQQA